MHYLSLDIRFHILCKILCGMISQYNAVTPYALPNLFLAITNRLRLHGFIVRDHYDRLNEFHSSMINWINEGKIKWKETIVEGLENAPNAFMAYLMEKTLARCW